MDYTLGMPETTLSDFAQGFSLHTYQKGQVVLAAGLESHYFYYLETGAVKMTKISKDGKVAVLHIFFPGSVFSLITLVNQHFNEYDFITLTDVRLRKIPRHQLQEFLRTQPQALLELNLRLLKGLSGLLKRIETKAFIPAYNQVASLLLYLARHFSSASESPSQLSIRITHQELAEWLGLTRENVSLQMKRLEKEGLITTQQHHIQLENVARLTELAETVASY